MSTTVKVILIIAAVLILAIICACLMTGGLVAISSYLSTSTPAPTMVLPTPPPMATLPPPATPTLANTPTTEATPTPRPLSPEEGFTLDGVDLKVMEVRYSLINGGEGGAAFIDPNEGFLLVVAITSNEKELGFVYDNYRPTTRLVDTGRDKTYEPNWNNWSTADSSTNSGYYLISFPMREAPKSAVLYLNDEISIDLTPILPELGELNDPWWSTNQTFEVSGMDLKLQSAKLMTNYTALDGFPIKKTTPGNKLLVVTFTSSFGDLTGASEWYPILFDRNDFENTLEYSYMTWSTNATGGKGRLEYIFEVPPERDDLVLYLPFENLMDINSIVKTQ